MKIYETERLVLRQIDKTFVEEVLAYYQRNKDFLAEWEAQRPSDFYTLEIQENNITKDLESYSEGTSFKLWIFKKAGQDHTRIIGCISFSLIVQGILQSCILGYKLDKDELNKGFITEALEKAIKVMFQDFGLHRIEAPIIPRNKGSIQVVKKLGFEYEGLSRKMIKVNGVWEDHMRWALVNE
ncbi:GNAT family protein [Cytobacillus sp. IB215665]|uniref:GNAT family N-acetyltransferase n=1 Tax=Cytobacillus sp. IB215665 TaxID=3097357 RepID=UPI002A0BE22B|nr:GNAT family protein [Cytobacillus sp. IB215665]MDX8367983.1 GNAT family protein [Cytobacillus sp. IB215665]